MDRVEVDRSRRVVERELEQDARHRRQQSHFAEVGRELAAVLPRREVLGAHVVDDLRVHERTQRQRARARSRVVDVGRGARAAACVGVQRHVGVGSAPLREARPAADVIVVVFAACDAVPHRARRAVVLRPVARGFAPARLAARSCAARDRAIACADAHRVGDDDGARRAEVVERDLRRNRRRERVVAEPDPSAIVDALVDFMQRVAARVAHGVASCSAAVGARAEVDVDRIHAIARHGQRPRRRCSRRGGGRARRGREAIAEACVAQRRRGRPATGFRIRGRALFVVADRLGSDLAVFAAQHDLRAHVHQHRDHEVVTDLGAVDVLDRSVDHAALRRPPERAVPVVAMARRHGDAQAREPAGLAHDARLRRVRLVRSSRRRRCAACDALRQVAFFALAFDANVHCVERDAVLVRGAKRRLRDLLDRLLDATQRRGEQQGLVEHERECRALRAHFDERRARGHCALEALRAFACARTGAQPFDRSAHGRVDRLRLHEVAAPQPQRALGRQCA